MDQAPSQSTRSRFEKIWQTNSTSAVIPQTRYVACHFWNRNCESSSRIRSAASSFSAASLVPSVHPTFPSALTQKGRWAVSVSALLFSRPYHRLSHSSPNRHDTRQNRNECELNIYREKHSRRCTVHTRYSDTKFARRARLEISRCPALLRPCVTANLASWQYLTNDDATQTEINRHNCRNRSGARTRPPTGFSSS